MESIFVALQWLGGVLKGLIEIISNIKINMFNRSTIYNIEKVEVNIDKVNIDKLIVIPDKETAVAFAEAMKQPVVEIQQPTEPS